jgi:hypothetical protein
MKISSRTSADRVYRVKADLKLAIQTRIKQYRIDIGVCKETLETTLRRGQPGGAGSSAAAAKASAAASREELFAGANGQSLGGAEQRINLTKSAEQRSRVMAATGRLEASSERLKETRLIPFACPPLLTSVTIANTATITLIALPVPLPLPPPLPLPLPIPLSSLLLSHSLSRFLCRSLAFSLALTRSPTLLLSSPLFSPPLLSPPLLSHLALKLCLFYPRPFPGLSSVLPPLPSLSLHR